jgi:hypothetical protein
MLFAHREESCVLQRVRCSVTSLPREGIRQHRQKRTRPSPGGGCLLPGGLTDRSPPTRRSPSVAGGGSVEHGIEDAFDQCTPQPRQHLHQQGSSRPRSGSLAQRSAALRTRRSWLMVAGTKPSRSAIHHVAKISGASVRRRLLITREERLRSSYYATR